MPKITNISRQHTISALLCQVEKIVNPWHYPSKRRICDASSLYLLEVNYRENTHESADALCGYRWVVWHYRRREYRNRWTGELLGPLIVKTLSVTLSKMFGAKTMQQL